jgi:ABC-type tungstate transport system substrate-binding protein
VVLNALMGLPPVVVGLAIYLLLSRAGPLGELGLLFTPGAMVVATPTTTGPWPGPAHGPRLERPPTH